MKLVLVTPLSEARRETLAQRFPQLTIVDCAQARDKVIDEIVDAEIVYGRVKPEELAAAKVLQFVQVGSHGAELLCYPEFIESGVRLANVRGMCSQTMAEHSVAVVLALLRGLPRAVRQQDQHEWRWEPPGPGALSGSCVGLLGTGSIGVRTGELFRALGCATIGCSRLGQPVDGLDTVYATEQLHDFLGAAHIVVSSLPMAPHTERIMDAAAFAAMKPEGLFVNVGRGGTVDEEALVAALENGTIAGASIDVAVQEPLSPESPLWDAPNLLITPHTSGWAATVADYAFSILVENVENFMAGRPLRSLVDPAAGY